METTSGVEFLNQLRFSVLFMGERNPGAWWNSSGMQKAGQSDLKAIFPRTSMTAAISHASELARRHHDERTRAAGVYHLFRLPTEIEAGIHKSAIEKEQAGRFNTDLESLIWRELADGSESNISPQEGPINLGALDLHRTSDCLQLGNTYKAAFESNLSCIPYFQLKR